ncbi:alpha/beta fold hydrolase [Chitinophaga arvensicola]|uniref:Pimeloyl-ACP methyl ester carboxylesterase n=1 Tax=Chitinophaga arvensicola TaxID=29529 RepID=A0A1I0NLX7_9BACT|nr:alpha/beta hydrolase [Chitinophaga arvensicola]SEW02180.1 Pimeloyl-ACP methyl ester carboxylesterase [Chitinophaga arvensicola]
MPLPSAFKNNSVTSEDGTHIGYRQTGAGEGIILVHGGMMASQNFTALAEELANEYTVYIPDRRGRGLSNDHVNNRGLPFEGQDLQAIINQTGAERIFGLSSGAVCTLQAVFDGARVKKVALYEPLMSNQGSNPLVNTQKYDQAIMKGNYGKAFISIIKATDGSSFFAKLPGFITVPLMNLAIKSEGKKDNGDKVPLQKLIAEWGYDRDLTLASAGMMERCKNITQPVLLMGGAKSQAFFKTALGGLAAAFPHCSRIEFPGLGHLGPDNSEQPKVIADALRQFFK